MPDQHQPASENSPDLAGVAVTVQSGATVVTVAGEIDISNIAGLTDTIVTLPNTGGGLIVDLTGVTYIDSTTVSVLHDLAMRLRERAQRLVVVSPPDSPPRRVLELTAFHLTASLCDTLDLALQVVGTTLL